MPATCGYCRNILAGPAVQCAHCGAPVPAAPLVSVRPDQIDALYRGSRPAGVTDAEWDAANHSGATRKNGISGERIKWIRAAAVGMAVDEWYAWMGTGPRGVRVVPAEWRAAWGGG